MKKSFIAAAVAGAAIVSMVPTNVDAAVADTATQDVNVNITGGSLTLDPTTINSFGTHTLVPKTAIVTTSFTKPVTVEDSTGLQEGWNLTLTTTDFVEQTDNAKTIPATALTLIKPTIQNLTVPGLPTVPTDEVTVMTSERTALKTEAVKIASGAAGKSGGTFAFTFGEISATPNSNPLGDTPKVGQALELTIDPSKIKINSGGVESQFVSTLTWTLSTGP